MTQRLEMVKLTTTNDRDLGEDRPMEADCSEDGHDEEKEARVNSEPIGEQADSGAEEQGDIADIEEADRADADPIAAMQEELELQRDRYLRLAAEYDNHRKRSAKEREATYIDARVDVIAKLLPVYDNLLRALQTECSDEAFYRGVEMTMTQLTEILENIGVVPILSVGEPFDPNKHNAVVTIEDPEFGEKIVAEEFQKGFMLGDRVIRFSTVAVAN